MFGDISLIFHSYNRNYCIFISTNGSSFLFRACVLNWHCIIVISFLRYLLVASIIFSFKEEWHNWTKTSYSLKYEYRYLEKKIILIEGTVMSQIDLFPCCLVCLMTCTMFPQFATIYRSHRKDGEFRRWKVTEKTIIKWLIYYTI